ncbi:hypothetical protein [Psychrobacter vallis]|uniref:hypothetical protein n=1 Tax=Psychrobacter vallis TaxID=248451 RepID=UPI001918D2FD|nr:hypothetical protein [Psychrobacter vallis]
MIQLDEFVDGVSIHLGNAGTSTVPRIAIIFAARQVVKQFCDESLSYIVHAFDPTDDKNTERQPTSTSIYMSRIDKQCRLALPRNTHIIKVWQLADCTCQPNDELDVIYDYPNMVNLYDNHADTSNVVVSLSVDQHALECPDYIFHQYYDGILSGIIAYLQAMPNREWAMPNFAENHQQKFMQAIALARRAVDKGFKKRQAPNSIPANFG